MGTLFGGNYHILVINYHFAGPPLHCGQIIQKFLAWGNALGHTNPSLKPKGFHINVGMILVLPKNNTILCWLHWFLDNPCRCHKYPSFFCNSAITQYSCSWFSSCSPLSLFFAWDAFKFQWLTSRAANLNCTQIICSRAKHAAPIQRISDLSSGCFDREANCQRFWNNLAKKNWRLLN